MPRNRALDALKLLLALMVVWFHAGAFGEESPALWPYIEYGFGRIAVPTFLIINGYFFQPVLARGEERRWLGWLVVMYLACTVLYLPFWALSLPPWPEAAVVVVPRLVFGYFHLWYLAALLMAVLLMVWLRHWPPARLAALAAALFAAGVGLQLVAGLDLFTGPDWLVRVMASVHLARNGLLLSFPYFCAGYLMRVWNVPARVPGVWLALMLPASLLGSLAEALLYLRHVPGAAPVSLLVCNALLTPALFLAALRVRLPLPAWPLSRLATGIYLLHPLALVALGAIGALPAWQAAIGAALVSGVVTQALFKLAHAWRQRAYLSDSIKSM